MGMHSESRPILYGKAEMISFFTTTGEDDTDEEWAFMI
jgi:hypothetical protein